MSAANICQNHHLAAVAIGAVVVVFVNVSECFVVAFVNVSECLLFVVFVTKHYCKTCVHYLCVREKEQRQQQQQYCYKRRGQQTKQ